MKKNSTLQQKLKSYSALAGAAAATAVASDANAQVIYTDITDVTVNTTGSGYQLDLDNGGVVDFTIAYQTYTSTGALGITYDYVFAYSATPTTNQLDTIPGPFAASHNSMDPINATNNWFEGSVAGPMNVHLLTLNVVVPGYGTYGYGDWLGATDKYLAIKFDLSGATHYGWARLDVAADSKSFVIKDYAYNGTANTAINAGDMGVTGMVQAKLENVRVFAANSIININMNVIESANVVVHDMMGKEVYSAQLNSSINRIDLSGTASGIYNVTITSEGKTFTKKVSL